MGVPFKGKASIGPLHIENIVYIIGAVIIGIGFGGILYYEYEGTPKIVDYQGPPPPAILLGRSWDFVTRVTNKVVTVGINYNNLRYKVLLPVLVVP